MTDTLSTDPELDSKLARSQLARRRRILQVVLELAAEGGQDAVQVRQIAQRAGVALRTIYNYFESRDMLLNEALTEWRRDAASQSVASVSGGTFEERVLSLLRHTFEGFVERPKLFETYMRLYLQDPWAQTTMTRALETILADTDPAFAEDFKLIMSRVTHSTLLLAAQGRIPLDQVWPQIEQVVRRVTRSRRE